MGFPCRYDRNVYDSIIKWMHGYTCHSEKRGIFSAEIFYTFKPFHQDKNLDRSISGPGPGLSLTREMSGRHGNTIQVLNQEGAGCPLLR